MNLGCGSLKAVSVTLTTGPCDANAVGVGKFCSERSRRVSAAATTSTDLNVVIPRALGAGDLLSWVAHNCLPPANVGLMLRAPSFCEAKRWDE